MLLKQIKNDIINKYSLLYPNQKIISCLYEPDLLTYENNSKNIKLKKIPKLSINNNLLITKLNKIFTNVYKFVIIELLLLVRRLL